jgi:hypothetical protein
MGALRIGHQRDRRCANLGQIGNFTRMIHAHFDDGSTMRGVQPSRVSGRPMSLFRLPRVARTSVTKLRLENGGDHFLGRCLAVRAGYGDHGQRETGAPGSGEAPQGEPRIGDDNR